LVFWRQVAKKQSAKESDDGVTSRHGAFDYRQLMADPT
jgi:hypothetical protein